MTTLTVSQILDMRTLVIVTEASNWARASRWAEGAHDTIEQQLLAELAGSQGATATAATERLLAVAENCAYIRVQCALVETSLNTLAQELHDARQRLQAALDEAAERGYAVAEDGGVTYPAATDASGVVVHEGGTATARQGLFDNAFNAVPDLFQGPHHQAAQTLAARIGNALNDVARIDASYANAVSRLDTDPGVLVTPQMWADTARDTEAVTGAARGALDASDIPQGMSPRENRDWWNALAPNEQEALVALFPAEIGAMDGLPAEARDQANRGVLEMEYGRVSEELARHLANEPEDAGLVWQVEKGVLEQRLASMDALQNRFAQTGEGGLPEAYLLGFDLQGAGGGQYIVANGNPDTADHTAVFVPGTSATLAGAEGDIRKMTDLWRETDRSAPGENVSTITWLGYNAPDTARPVIDGDIMPEAMSDSWARDAAPDFSAFTEGLRASHAEGDPSHTTLIGHSYGSTVIGAAAMDGGLYADDVLAAGSPGMLVDNAGELGVGRGHVWSMAAGVGQDQVPLLGAAFTTLGGGGPLDVDIETTGPWGVPSIDFGDSGPEVPSMESFGANLMATDSGDHSGYWTQGSLSLENQAQVVLGRYGEVELG